MKTKKGRKPIINGINGHELKKWINENDKGRAIIKCQALFSLINGTKVSEICKVLNITRETLRVWRNQFQFNGIDGLTMNKKRKGRKTYLTDEVKSILQQNLRNSPENFGYGQKRWDGKLLAEYLEKESGIKVSIRTAQNWINKLGIRASSRKRITFG